MSKLHSAAIVLGELAAGIDLEYVHGDRVERQRYYWKAIDRFYIEIEQGNENF